MKKPANGLTHKLIDLSNREISNYELFLSTYNHPLIPNFFGVIDSGLKNYPQSFLIEYINGENLQNINKDYLSDNDKLTIVFELMIVIEFIHRNGYVHRDLKPNNIMIDNNKNAVLIDFDRMVKNDDDDKSGAVGSPYYTAPESDSSNNYSFKSDVYSLGKIIHFLFENQIESKEYEDIKSFYIKCTNEDKMLRTPINELIINFYTFFCSQIQTQKIFTKNKEYFSEIYDEETISTMEDLEADQNDDSPLDSDNSYVIQSIMQKSTNIMNNSFKILNSLNKLNNSFKILNTICSKNSQVIYEFASACEEIKNYQMAIIYYTQTADLNHLEAQYELGLIYYNGEITNRNINKSINYFKKAADQNHSDAQYFLCLIFSDGKYVSRDIDKAIYYFSKSAEQNNSNAQNQLALLYMEYNNNNNGEKVIELLSKSASQGNEVSLHNLAIRYLNGEYVKQDINKAIELFTQASDKDYADSQYALGIIYSNGKYIKRNINKSIEYFTKAADNNYAPAQFSLGLLYLENKYINRDIDKAIHFFTLAAEQNYQNAQYNLGIIYSQPIYERFNINKAIEFFTLAANQGDVLSLNHLGILYENGKYVPIDIKKAIYYYKLAANKNHPNSIYNLGLLYERGSGGIKPDIEKAIYYYKQAAKLDQPDAQFKLGLIYHAGQKVKYDMKEAIHYYELASKHDNVEALYNLGLIYGEGIHIKQDIKKAMDYYSLAANNGCLEALINIGVYYYNGFGVKKDVKKAIHYFEKAAKKNNSYAQYLLGKIYLGDEYEYINNGSSKIKRKIISANFEKAIKYFKEAANNNNDKAQYFLGIFYLYGFHIPRNDVKGITLLTLASEQLNCDACFALGYFYHEGMHVKEDIKKAIRYYKDSTINNLFAKNNLGIIYKYGFRDEIKSNINNSILYFNEANAKNDLLSMYNLAHIYLFYKNYESSIDESIELLLKICLKIDFTSFQELLCLAIIKKHEFNISVINNEISKIKNRSPKLASKLLFFINVKKLINKSIFEEKIESYKKIDYIYTFVGTYKISSSLVDRKSSEDKTKKNITLDFYEGFGINL